MTLTIQDLGALGELLGVRLPSPRMSPRNIFALSVRRS